MGIDGSNPFTKRAQQKYTENPAEDKPNPFSDPFTQRVSSPEFEEKKVENLEENEGLLKSTIRTAMQPVMGFLGTTVPGLAAGFFQLLAAGEVYDPEAVEGFKRQSEKYGIPFDEEAYYNAANKIMENIPTVHNLGRIIEEKTGIPLEAKTRVQKGLRFATEATMLSPAGATLRPLNTALPKPALGVGLEAAKEVMTELGMNEQLAELASFALLKQPPEGAASLTMGKAEKPSGLKERQFENVKEPRKVTEARHEKINESLEKDFRGISENIIKESPLAETHAEMGKNPGFKSEVGDQFKQVEKIAEQINEYIPNSNVRENLVDTLNKKRGMGITPGEYDRDYRKFMGDFVKGTKNGTSKPSELVTQYRNNNKELTGAYEPGKSKNFNEAKKDALLDYNRAISKTIEEKFPNSEFSKLFKETNKKWSQVLDTEKINNFIDSVFDGKINHKEARKFFDNKHTSAPFRKALGEQYPKFEQLMKDLLTTEQPYKMLKVGKSLGWGDLVEGMGLYILNPKIAAAKKGYDVAKEGFRRLVNMTLDKPKLAIKWKSAVDNLKKGNFEEAIKDFEPLKKEAEAIKADEIITAKKTKTET